jgi:hypothetical protein
MFSQLAQSLPSLRKVYLRVVEAHSAAGTAKYSIRVSIGRHALDTSACPNAKGDVYFNQMLRLDNIVLPMEVSSIPDVFVHLLKGGTAICYARIKVRLHPRGCCCRDSYCRL